MAEHQVTTETTVTIENLSFLKELYVIMDDFNIHRIYRASLKDGKLSEAHQTLDTNIGKGTLLYSISKSIHKHLPMLYFKIFYNIHLKRYRYRLKKLFKKYELSTLSAASFSLFQGIYRANNKLCINGVDITTNSQKIYHIDKLYLDF